MQILAHRGFWVNEVEKNDRTAIQSALDEGFGVETDVRDWSGKLVISHDPPTNPNYHLTDVFRQSALSDSHANTLALNIKSDGLAPSIKSLVDQFPKQKYFVFDMSVPDVRQYIKLGLHVFTRASEVEMQPAFLTEARGVWLDAFFSDWYELDVVESFLANGKEVCVVSPELHGRPHQLAWDKLKQLNSLNELYLCTDFPDQAKEFFKC